MLLVELEVTVLPFAVRGSGFGVRGKAATNRTRARRRARPRSRRLRAIEHELEDEAMVP